MKIKYLALVILLKKTDYNAKVKKIDKYIDTSEFNKLAVDVFTARIAQANLVTKTDFGVNCRVLTEELPQIKQNTYLLKMN